MKKLLSIALSVILALSLTIGIFAEEFEIGVNSDNWGENAGTAIDAVTWGDGTVTADQLSQISFKLPTECVEGDTVTLHIKGTSNSDFRVWLLATNAKTASNQWKASTNGYSGTGDFEFFIELTCQYFDADFEIATDVNFKASSWDTKLEGFTLSYIGVTYGTLADLDDAALEEVAEYITAAEAAIANGDLDAANAAIAVIEEKGALGFASCANKANELKNMIKDLEGNAILESMQSYIDTVTNAVERAKNANGDVEVISAAYDEAITAADYVFDNANGYSVVTEKGKELRVAAKEIKTILADAQEAAEEAARIAEEEAAAKAESTKTVLIVVAVVAVVVVIAAVVVVILKKKKK